MEVGAANASVELPPPPPTTTTSRAVNLTHISSTLALAANRNVSVVVAGTGLTLVDIFAARVWYHDRSINWTGPSLLANATGCIVESSTLLRVFLPPLRIRAPPGSVRYPLTYDDESELYMGGPALLHIVVNQSLEFAFGMTIYVAPGNMTVDTPWGRPYNHCNASDYVLARQFIARTQHVDNCAARNFIAFGTGLTGVGANLIKGMFLFHQAMRWFCSYMCAAKWRIDLWLHVENRH